MVSPLAPLSWQHVRLDTARQRRQTSLLWHELATDLCRDSRALCNQATAVCLRSRQVRAQRASLRAEGVALCQAHAPPG